MHEIKHPLCREEKTVPANPGPFIGHVDLHCVLLLYPTARVNGATLGADFKSDYSVHFPANRSENTQVYTT